MRLGKQEEVSQSNILRIYPNEVEVSGFVKAHLETERWPQCVNYPIRISCLAGALWAADGGVMPSVPELNLITDVAGSQFRKLLIAS